MKKYFYAIMRAVMLALLPAILFVAQPYRSAAQCPPPAPNDYPNYPWAAGNPSPDIVESPIGSGCFISFEWCWRVTPFDNGEGPGEIHIWIGPISRTGNCSGLFDEAAIREYVKVAARWVIAKRHPWSGDPAFSGINWAIPPCPQKSRSVFRVVNASCYSEEFFDPTTSQMKRKPCMEDGGQGRCIQRWKVCWQMTNGIQTLIEELLDFNNGATCSGKTTGASPNEILNCIPVCDGQP